MKKINGIINYLITVRMPPELAKHLTKQAKKKHISRNEEIVSRLNKSMNKDNELTPLLIVEEWIKESKAENNQNK